MDAADSSYFLCFISFVASLLIIQFLWRKSISSTTNHPPSPPALPIIGHMHLLSVDVHKSFQSLASRYGPLLSIHVGASTSVLVSSADVAKEFLKTHELSFASKPKFGNSKYQLYNDSSFFFAEYSAYWRFLKKICMTELLSAAQLNRFQEVRKQETLQLLENLAKLSCKGEACDMSKEVLTLTNNIICRMAMSARCSGTEDEGKEVWELTKGIVYVAGKLSFGDVLGPLGKFDLFGYGKKLREMMVRFDKLVEKIMKLHESERLGGGDRKTNKDMMDILLDVYEDKNAEIKLTRDDLKGFLLDIFLGGTHTSSVALQWMLAELINHPEIMNKLRDEINTVVGSSRLVQESDVPNLPYLKAVVKESLRLHPPVPFVMRRCREDCKVNGYDILKNARVLINVYAISRDKDYWENPTEFIPERFVDVEKKKGMNFNFLPFGAGRRACPGEGLVDAVMHVVVAAFVQCFDWRVKGGEEKADMEEGSGFAIGMARPLVCYPIAIADPSIISLTTSVTK